MLLSTRQEKLKRGAEPIFRMCPPVSPDLNPLDVNIWSILEAEACAKTHDTVEGLKVSLKKALAKIPQEKLRVLIESFRGRLEKVVKSKGGHIEI